MSNWKTIANVALLTILVACGVPAAEHEKVVEERDAALAEVAKLKTDLEKAKAAAASASKRTTRRSSRRGPPILATDENIQEFLDTAKITRESKLAATIKTSLGDIQCELYPDKAPMTVANFVGLAEGNREWTDAKSGEKVKGKPLYDGTIFHRVIPNFMIQGGDPEGRGTGGPGYRFDDETDNGLAFDKVGLLAMANAGPKTNGSQFFITVRETPHLNGKHTIFGSCDTGTVDKIVNTPAERTRPTTDVVIETIAIERKG
jgi:peptidyl-prolyl cis-trans isomerase A (cyclophilin A)